MPLTYANYLELDTLLSLQSPRSEGPEHDEMLFIIIHQAYELWFKEILHEVDHLVALLRQGELPRASHTLRRIRTVTKVLVAQMDILETMTPLEFLSFRDRLESASGFQSAAFRELEFVLGYKRKELMAAFRELPQAQAKLRRRYEDATLWDAFLFLLAELGYAMPKSQLERDVTQSVEADESVQKVLHHAYATDPRLADFCELMIDVDEGMQEWRYRHVKMVERTIGDLPGTGGSSGVTYLRKTLFKPFFPDLWAIRSEFARGK